jgi:hypothetical protein
VAPLNTGVYSVIGTASNGCTGTATILLTVNPSPTLIVSSSVNTLCIGQSAVLTINGNGTSYSLNANPTATSITIFPTVTTSYTVHAVNSFGCNSSQVFTQIVTNCTGLQTHVSNTYLKIYPNPSNGICFVQSSMNETIWILNELGQVVQTIELSANTEQRISGLKPGLYLIQTNTSRSKLIVTD